MRNVSGGSVGVAAVIVVLVSLVGNVATQAVELPSWAKPWTVAVLAVLVVTTVLVELYRHHRDKPTSTAIDLEAVAASLGAAVGRHWQAEQQLWQIHDPYPLPVRWEVGSAEVSDHWANIRQAPPGTDPGPLALAGGLAEIAKVYQRIPSGRLIVLGRAGAGKTILAHRLVADLLATRTPTGRVPVVFNLSTWDPTTTPFSTWLAARLAQDHPGLAVPGYGTTTLAADLLADERILPILDGFDEIAAGLQTAALQALNRTPTPLVLTSRPKEYHSAVAAADVLTAAAVVAIADLTVADLTAYLTRSSPPTARAGTRWTPVLAGLTAHPLTPPAATVTAALATPLTVYLARTIYSDIPHHDPAELLDTVRFPTAEAIEDHLLDAFVPAVYLQPHPNQTNNTNRRPWDNAAAAHRWHTYLAKHLHRLDTHDFAWWQLPNVVPRAAAILTLTLTIGLTFWLLSGLMSGITYGLFRGLASGLEGQLPFGLAVGLAFGFTGWFTTRGSQPQRTQFRLRGRIPAMLTTTVGLAFGLAMLTGWLIGYDTQIVGVAIRTTEGLAFGLVFGFTGWFTIRGSQPQRTQFRLRGRIPAMLNRLTFGLAAGLTSWLTFGLVFGLTSILPKPFAYGPESWLLNIVNDVPTSDPTFALIFWLQGWLPTYFAAGLAAGLTYGLVFGLAAGLAAGLTYGLAAELDVDTVLSPVDVLRIDRIRTITLIVTFGLTYGLTAWAADGFPPDWSSLSSYLTSGLTYGLAYGLTFTAWGKWIVTTQLWLPATGKLPQPVMAFLMDAHRRGVLRQTGGKYQYRHVRLRDRLAVRTPS